MTSDPEKQVKTWLQSALKSENLGDFSVSLEGTTEKGDGYLGDVVFVNVKGGDNRELNLVLKCSKDSAKTRETTPMSDVFLNEINFFEHILPKFSAFQREKNVPESDVLEHSVAKYYGKFISSTREIFALTNLKKLGYTLWAKQTPLTMQHAKLVLSEYAKLHAIGAAMRDQRKGEFEDLVKNYLNNELLKKFMQVEGSHNMFIEAVEDAKTHLKGQIDDKFLTLLDKFGERKYLDFIICELNNNRFSVICHGDCWNNNFMYYSKSGEQEEPTKVAILDWQIMKVASPISDLSYFLFATASQEIVDNMDQLLHFYHKMFSKYMSQLGSSAEKIYPLSEFLKAWKSCAKYGFLMSMMLVKMVLTDKEDVKDIADVIESGQAIFETFSGEIKHKEAYTKRIKYLLQYAGENGILLFED